MIELGKVYQFKSIGPKYIFSDKVWTVISNEKQVINIPYHQVLDKLYPQGSYVPCKCVRIRKGNIEYKLDLISVYKKLYKEGNIYPFVAEKICTDSSSFARYILLKDEYGIEYKLYHPSSTDKGAIGKTINCKVVEITNTSITLETTTKFSRTIDPVSLEKQMQLFEELHNRRIRSFEEFNQDDFKGVWENAIGLYPDSAHFIYELLQNADDAGATQVSIILKSDTLYFKHNGTERFSVTSKNHVGVPGHINSITGIGNTAKDNAETNKIGKFGVGFKSVFQYTDCPEIYDDAFKFKIENYIIPILIDHDHDFREEGETLFCIPFKDPEVGYNDIREKLMNLSNATLFLNNLHTISWTNAESDENEIFEKKIVGKHKAQDITCQQICLSDSKTENMLWLFTREITIKNEGIFPINVGFYLNNDGEIDTKEIRNVCCYFPTDESFQSCFISHAPFLLVKSRSQILDNNDINKRLVSAIGDLVADVLPELKKLKLLNGNLFDLIAYKHYRPYSTYKKLINPSAICIPCLDKIKRSKLLMSRNGEFYGPKDIFLYPTLDIADLISAEQLQTLNKRTNPIDFICKELNEYDFCEWDELGVDLYIVERFARQITAEFMKAQTMSWVNKFYSQLIEKLRKHWNNVKDKSVGFLAAPIVLTTNDEWVTPFYRERLNIYYDGAGADGYNIVSPDFCKHKNIKKFLDEIGCKAPDQEDYIKTKILPKYNESESLSIDEVINDFTLLYHHAQKIEKARYNDFCQLIGNFNVIIYTKDDEYMLDRPCNVYEDSIFIKEYFHDHNKVAIIDSSLYENLIKEVGKLKFYEFLNDIGIRRRPILLKRQVWFHELSSTQKLELKLESRRFTSYNSQETYIEGLEDCLKNRISKQLSIQLFNCLIELNVERYRHLRANLYYRTDHYYYCHSRTIEILKSSRWLYNTKNELVSPKDITREELAMVGYPNNSDLCDALEIHRKIADLTEYGLSTADNEAFVIGNKAKELGLSPEDLEEAAKRKKAKEEQKKREEQKKETSFLDSETATREELSKGDGKEFSTTNEPIKEQNAPQPTKNTKEEIEQKIQDFKEQSEKELQKKLDTAELREAVKDMPRYSKEWFDAMLTLEYGEEGENTNKTSKTISISFGKVSKEAGTERVFVLKSPSKCPIPLAIEEISGIEVKFSFTDREDFSRGFEVASVRDFTLRLKAKLKDVDYLNSIDWSKCTNASIDVNNPGKLMNKLIDAFNELNLPEKYDLKENLENNISFVFGPPGTGKTTYLANYIKDLMDKEYYCKTLVLCPTNKACDVLTKKVYDLCPDGRWLGRFVATGEEEIENLGLVIDRDSYIYEQDQCCIVSTMARLPYDGFNKLGADSRLKDLKWDYVIIDEASMIPLAQIVFAIYKFSPDTQIIIAGDPMQITPIVQEEEWKRENIYSMVKLDRFDNPQTEPIQFNIKNLETQYRSVPAIGRVFSEYAYAGLLGHHRKDDEQIKLEINGMPLKALTLIPFKVSRMDDIFRPYKLSGSNVHIYSVLLIVELCKYMSKEYAKHEEERKLKIGIICPYVAEAQMIEKLIEQVSGLPQNVEINVGTIHGFQGDECDAIFVVLNPPVGLKGAADKVFLNDKNIINVAISRARDYLFVMYPHKSTDGFDKLYEMKKLGRIMNETGKDVLEYTCDDIERIIFGKPFYIEHNSFVTTHQLANVYTEGAKKYEVRIDTASVDIQISKEEQL